MADAGSGVAVTTEPTPAPPKGAIGDAATGAAPSVTGSGHTDDREAPVTTATTAAADDEARAATEAEAAAGAAHDGDARGGDAPAAAGPGTAASATGSATGRRRASSVASVTRADAAEALHSLSEAEVQYVRDAYDVADVDGDGTVGLAEITAVLGVLHESRKVVDKVVAQCARAAGRVGGEPTEAQHVDSEGEADFVGFDAFALALAPHIRGRIGTNSRWDHMGELLAQTRAAFRACDEDGSGTVTAGELSTVLAKLGAESDDEAVKALMAKLDRDGDGDVSFFEFIGAVGRGDVGVSGAFSVDKLSKLANFFDSELEVKPEEMELVLSKMTLPERLGTRFLKWHTKGQYKRRLKREQPQRLGDVAATPPQDDAAGAEAGAGELRPADDVRVADGGGSAAAPADIPRDEVGSAKPDDIAVDVGGVAEAKDDGGDSTGPDVAAGARSSGHYNEAPGASVSAGAGSSASKALKREKSAFARMKTLEGKKTMSHTTITGDEAHMLTDEQRNALWREELGAVLVAGFLGILSGVAVGFVERHLQDRFDTDGTTVDERGNDPIIQFWCWLGATAIVATTTEILLCYVNATRAAVATSRIVGLELFPIDQERGYIAAALARAALDIANPTDNTLGIDPLREARRQRCAFLAVALLYKGKTGATNFIVKLILRRVLSRALAKQLLPFAAAPINAMWNMLVLRKVMADSRIVVMGPSAVVSFLSHLLVGKRLSLLARQETVRAAGVTSVGKSAMHPNTAVLITQLRKTLGDLKMDPATLKKPELDDKQRFFDVLSKTRNGEERQVALQVLFFALVLDGLIGRRERKLYDRVREVCHMERDNFAILQHQLSLFVDGRQMNYRLFEEMSTPKGSDYVPQRSCCMDTKFWCNRFMHACAI